MSSLNVNVFRDGLVTQPLDFTVGCVATCGSNVLLVGTTDGKIAVYDLKQSADGLWDAQLVHLHSAKHHQAFHTLICVPEKGLLFTATADAIAVHRLPVDQLTRRTGSAVGGLWSSSGGELLAQVSVVSGLKEAMLCSARKYRGVYLLAVLLRRSLQVYQYVEPQGGGGSGGFVLYRESAALPESGRCLAWTSKGVLVGFRKEYYMAHLPAPSSSSSSPPYAGGGGGGANLPLERLYGVGSTKAAFVLSVDPVPEALVGIDGAFCRALPDGSLIGGDDDAVPWAGGAASIPQPALSTYAHPYLLAGQTQSGGGQRTTLEVYLPLATTIPTAPVASGGGRPRPALCQAACVGNLRHLSRRGMTDLDRAFPTKTSPVDPSRRDPIIAVDGANRVHVLTAAHAAEQVRAFATAGHYEVGELICQLCPNEVPDAVRSFAVTLSAANDFARGNFAPAMQRLREGDAHPLLAVHMIGDPLLSPSVRSVYTPPRDLEPLLAKCTSATAKSAASAAEAPPALSAVMHYLLAQRLRLRDQASKAADEALLGCIDTALLKLMALMKRDEALQDLAADTNWCHAEECAAFLLAHQRWVALAAFLRSVQDHERALGMLCSLAATGHPSSSSNNSSSVADAQPLPKEVRAACQALVHSGYVVQELLTPQEKLVSRTQEAAAAAADATGTAPVPALREPHLTQMVAILTALAYLRGLSLTNATHKQLYARHAPFFLSHLPSTQLSLSMFFSAANRRHFREALTLIQASFRGSGGSGVPVVVEGGASSLAAVTDFQAMILGDAHLTEEQRDERAPDSEKALQQHAASLHQPGEEESKGEAASVAAGDMADIHAGYWQNLALLVFGGAPGDPTPLPERRRQLARVLASSPYIDYEAAEAFFEDAEIRAVSCPERAIVYRRLGSHGKALDMLLDECGSVSDAKAYCEAARQEGGDEEAYLTLFRKLFQMGREEETRTHRPSAWTREALDLLGSNSEVGNAQSVLPMLPDDLPVRDIRSFLVNSLRQSVFRGRSRAFENALLATQERQLTCALAAETAKGVLVADDGAGHVCAVCGRRLRPETAFLLFPNGVVAHVGCVEDRRVCPVTGIDFRKGVVPALLRK